MIEAFFHKISPPLAAILAFTELMENSTGEFMVVPSCLVCLNYIILAGTMFELVKALNDGAEVLKAKSSNPISLNAGCELFIAFVTLIPHDSIVCLSSLLPRSCLEHCQQSFADLKKKLIRQGQQYAAEALAYRRKIAELAVGFIKDGSVVGPSFRVAEPTPIRLFRSSHTRTQELS